MNTVISVATASLVHTDITVREISHMASKVCRVMDELYTTYPWMAPILPKYEEEMFHALQMLEDGSFNGPFLRISENGVDVDTVAVEALYATVRGDILETPWQISINQDCTLACYTPRVPQDVTDFILSITNQEATVKFDRQTTWYDGWSDYEYWRSGLEANANKALQWLKDHDRA